MFATYVVGHATSIFINLPKQFDGTVSKKLLEVLYYVLPNLSNFDIASEAANGTSVSAAYVVWALVYGTVYTVMLLALAALAFEDKDV